MGILAGCLHSRGVCRRWLGCVIRRGSRYQCFGRRTGGMFMLEPQDLGQFLMMLFEKVQGAESLWERDPVSAGYKSHKEEEYQADLLVRTVLRSRGEFTRGQVMFFTRGDRVRLAGLEHCVSRVGVGLGGWDQPKR